jgi:DNA-binding transcriptional regulator YdaS (Cro superfamily)
MPKPQPEVISKSAFARRLGISPAQVSQYVAMGMPVLASGKLDYAVAKRWVERSILPPWPSVRSYKPR